MLFDYNKFSIDIYEKPYSILKTYRLLDLGPSVKSFADCQTHPYTRREISLLVY